MPEGGIIKVKAENVAISAQHVIPLVDGKYVKIEIEDEGVGIPKEYLDKIFDPYFSTKQKGKGSGLGLTSCHYIIQKHDGHITVESELGIGTTFYIYLPASQKEIAEKKDSEEQIVLGQGKILVMDDEDSVRDVAGIMLKHIGYEVGFAEDGAEAIELYQKAKKSDQPFDALIMDLTIPGGMGGEEAIRQLLEIDPNVKAIVSSGYSTDAVMSDFKQYGFSGVITKPYTVAALSEAINKVIQGISE
jgi:CheY-like chemotaxis protein